MKWKRHNCSDIFHLYFNFSPEINMFICNLQSLLLGDWLLKKHWLCPDLILFCSRWENKLERLQRNSMLKAKWRKGSGRTAEISQHHSVCLLPTSTTALIGEPWCHKELQNLTSCHSQGSSLGEVPEWSCSQHCCLGSGRYCKHVHNGRTEGSGTHGWGWAQKDGTALSWL